MPARHRPFTLKRGLLAILLAFPAQQALAANCTWNTAAGNWNALANWLTCATGNGNPAQTPGSADTATIGAAGVVTVNTAQSILNLNNSGRIDIDATSLNLVSGGATNNAGGVINVANGAALNQQSHSITGGTINTTGTGKLVANNSNSNFLSGVTLNGLLDLAGGTAIERITNGLTLNGTVNINNNSVLSFNGDQTLAGNGTIVLGNTGGSNRALSMQFDTELTIGSNMVVRGENGTLGQTYLNGGNQRLVNNGRISADVAGGTISLTPANGTTNNGVLEAQNGGTLVLNSDVFGAVGSSIVAGAGSAVVQSGVALSGVINTSGDGNFRASNSNSNSLNGVTFNGALDMASGTMIERVTGGLTLNGTANINSNSVLSFSGDQTLGGTGAIVLGDTGASNRALSMEGDTVLTIGSNMVVRGQNGTLGQAYLAGGNQHLVNDGLISADVLGGSISLTPGGGTTNNGIIEAKNGGTLVLNSSVTGAAGSLMRSAAGSTIVQNGVALSGVINTTGDGNFRASNSNSNFLNGVNFNGVLDLASGTMIERVASGLTLNGTVNINSNSVMSFAGDQTLGGTGVIVLGDTGASNRALSMEGDTVLTIGSNMVVRGQNGTLGQAYLSGGNQRLVNNGLISGDVAGGTISLSPAAGTTNNGIIEAKNGGMLFLNSDVLGAVGSLMRSGVGSTIVQNGVSLSGVINTTGNGAFRATNSNSNFLNGVTFNGMLDLASGTMIERVTAGLTLNGTINVNSNSVLSFSGDQTLGGNGSIVLGDTGASNRALSMQGDTALTIGAGISVTGQNGTVGQAYLAGGNQTLINNGSILANVGSGTIALTPTLTQNASFIGAANGGTLRLDSNVTQTGAGQLNAAAGSQVLQNGVSITGGVINTAGTGRLVATNNNSNVLSGVTLAGVLDLASGTSIERVNSGLTLSNGTINVNSNSVLSFSGDQTLGGNGSIVLGDTGASNRALSMQGDTVLTVGLNVVVRGHNGTLGQAYLAGGTQNIINTGSIVSDGGGTISVVPTAMINNGLMRAQNGTMTIQSPLSGTGTLQVDAAGVMNLANGAKTQGQLLMGAAGAALNLNTGNLTISSDYTNVGAGTGNSFNRRAGVSGAGLIVASANAAQAITGAQISNGNTANATLTIGNVRVGATSFDYQVANTGATGPSLRGAIQTNVNGGNITDARLSGAGVTASNYNAGAPGGNSGNLSVTFTAANAGALAPLVDQMLNLRSNFENIADQKLNIVLAGAAAAYNAAVGNAASPVQVANQRIGGSNTATVVVTNAAAPGAFSEDLNASVGATSGATGSGNIVGRIAGASVGGGAITVGVSTAAAGAQTGTVTLNYQTAGTVAGVSNTLGVASVGSQVVTVNGNVYQVAQPTDLPANIDLGNFRAGTAQSQTVTLTNTNISPAGFQEGLNASIGTVSGAATGSGALNNVAAGASGNLQIGVTGVVGANTGSVQVQLATNGTGTSGLGNQNLGGAQTINVSGTGYRLAEANTIAPINFGNVLANSIQTRTLTISNTATADGFSEALNAAFGTIGGANAASFTTNGVINGLLAGGNDNTSMVVTLNTSATGTKTANVQILLDSNGTAIGNGLGITALPTQTVNLDGVITGVVGNLASAGLSPTTVNFGKFREGAANQTQQLTVSNLTQGPGEGLNASFGVASGGASNNAGSITSLATNSSNNTSMSVTLGGLATAGAKSGTQVLNFVSDGSFNNGVPTALPSQSVDLSAEVYRLATAGVTTPINLAARRVGDAAATGLLTLSNTAANDGFSEGLRGTIGAAPAGFNVTGPANTELIAAGGNTTRTVTLDTATAGVFGGSIAVALASDGAGTSGFAELALPGQSTVVSGNVYASAVAQLNTTNVNFGIVRVGDVVATQNVSVTNAAAPTALNDTMAANVGGVTGPFSGSGSASGLGASASNAPGTLTLGLATGAAGIFNGTASIGFTSQNPEMADLGLGSQLVNLSAQVNNLANADFDKLSGLGTLRQTGIDYELDFGNVSIGALLSSILQLDNDVSGPADLLSGGFNITGPLDFAYSGWNSFTGLAAGGAIGGLTIDFSALTAGQFRDEVIFGGFSTNGSGPDLAQSRRLTILANVIDGGGTVPEPGSLALLLAAAVAGAIARRRQALARESGVQA